MIHRLATDHGGKFDFPGKPLWTELSRPRSGFGLNERFGVQSAAVNYLADLPILERKLGLTLQVKYGPG